ncbi:neprilysin-1 isoform X2 [Rhipicephalus microplus]
MDEAYAFSATLSECSKRISLQDSPVVSADICVNSLLQLAPAALAHLLLGAIGHKGMVKRSGEITENIRNASVHSFENLAWMDANTSKANVSPFAVDTEEMAINYGSLGRIIGHELSHAFQMSTSSLDNHVQPLTLYSPASRKEFLARLNCLAKQVNDGSGSQTLGNNSISEAFADNAGLEKSYLAFKGLTQSDPLIYSKPINPLGYTAQQMFFVSSCFVFCAFQGYAFERNSVYPPPFLRCNTPAMNSRDFGSAFNCAQGAPMNPLVRCNFH